MKKLRTIATRRLMETFRNARSWEITIDPRDKKPRPYVSASTIFWERHRNINKVNKRAWCNGAMERCKPTSVATRAKNPKQCLEYDKNIVWNLSVADNDHAINELVIDQNGDLLISLFVH